MALSPLETEIRRRIRLAGSIPVREYMELCLSHPDHGYYMTRDPFGRGGDFVTAPEVSQIFGELIGAWAASVWHSMGQPENVRLVELGPGRGTMMMDILRVTNLVPAFRAAIVLHMVEISPVLQRQQQQLIGALNIPMLWHRSFDDVPIGPAIVLANEFIDALPVNQAVKQSDGWHERTVAIGGDGNLDFGVSSGVIPLFDRLVPAQFRDAPPGTIYEWRSDSLPRAIGQRMTQQGGAALLIDYGHTESTTGDTLQAVAGHAFVNPLASPGAADLTAHVDFEAFALAAESMGAGVHGPINQTQLLRNLGIEQRALALKANAPPGKAADIDAAVDRLLGDSRTGMGRLFKAIAIAAPGLRKLPGF
jgi:NADH dehydrogenase [ubiquinone] 1 alpha subcomplex assembly factor 7